MGPSARRLASDLALDALVLAVAAAHVFLAPYAKVEESFNLQATHDVMYHGWDLASYDHHAFPGVVPRTFIGAIALAALAKPLHVALVFLRVLDSDESRGTKMGAQIAARLALATVTVAALGRMRRVLRSAFGEAVGVAFACVVASQFHLTFYASRTLPNTFALALTTLAAADWFEAHVERTSSSSSSSRDVNVSVDARDFRAVFLLTASFVIFRCDTVLLLAPVGAHMLRTRAFSLPQAVNWGARCVAACLAITVAVDTAMWAPPSETSDASGSSALWPGSEGIMWPEGRVFWFNTYENKSKEWGVAPFRWYFTNALPRSLGTWTPFVPFGAAAEPKTRPVFLVALCFVAAYSFLPHKELRFVFPALPLCDACAAVGVVEAYTRLGSRQKRVSKKRRDDGRRKGSKTSDVETKKKRREATEKRSRRFSSSRRRGGRRRGARGVRLGGVPELPGRRGVRGDARRRNTRASRKGNADARARRRRRRADGRQPFRRERFWPRRVRVLETGERRVRRDVVRRAALRRTARSGVRRHRDARGVRRDGVLGKTSRRLRRRRRFSVARAADDAGHLDAPQVAV
uniref:Mannosyltransferase n=1 Tax=Micromonas pusilla TaxID=38833 RepID=A0A7S0D9Y8_MICPS